MYIMFNTIVLLSEMPCTSRGKLCWDYPSNQNILENLSADLEKYIADTTLNVESETDAEHIPEHKHECKGAHSPAVLPLEIVLAGRVLVKSVIKRRGSTDTFHLSEISVGQWDLKHRVKFLEDECSFRCQCRGCLNVNFSDLALNGFHCVKSNYPGLVLDSGVVNIEREKLKYVPHIVSTSSVEPHLQVEEFNTDEINKLAPHVQTNNIIDINPGFCLNCGSYRDLESSSAAVDNAGMRIRRLRDAIVSQDVSSNLLLDALSSLGLLRSTLFAYNWSIAEAEDNLAQAFCLVGVLMIEEPIFEIGKPSPLPTVILASPL